ncbi:MAG: alpha-2-macroglobulin, partial [Planctomycetota bacterium]
MMFTSYRRTACLLGFPLLLTLSGTPLLSADAEPGDLRKRAAQLYQENNFAEAYELYRQITLAADADPKTVGQDLQQATYCLVRLNRVHEIDAYREAVIARHADNWRLLFAAARNYMSIQHDGFMIAGEFRRGRHRGGGRQVFALERDRVRSLQLMVQASEAMGEDATPGERFNFYFQLANDLLHSRGGGGAWRLQYLTNIDELPDYEESWNFGRGASGAPVDAEGTPIYHDTVRTFAEAKTDGERWRWALDQAAESDPSQLNRVRFTRAQFLMQQFGVQTMAYFGRFFAGGLLDDDTTKDESGTYALHTLGENETIARLATGIKRFELPDEHNFIKLFEQIARGDAAGRGNWSFVREAQSQLAQIFQNRRQYPRAAEVLRALIKNNGGASAQRQLSQIVDNWGRFEPVMNQPAGSGATVDYRFRNGKKVRFEAHPIKVELLLSDLKEYLESNPAQIEWNKINIGNIGYRLVHQNERKYLGEKTASWELDVEPREAHFDKRVTVTTPLQKAGAYLVTAKMDGGNTSKIVVWLSDTAIVKKPLDGATFYFVADAVSGTPLDGVNVEFFGYRQEYLGNRPKGGRARGRARQYTVHTKNFAEKTDGDGQIILDGKRQPSNFQWIAIARTKRPDGQPQRLAYLGFSGVWHPRYTDPVYHQTKTFAITDRPVYRPDQTVKFKCWIRRPRFDQPAESSYADKEFYVEFFNPKRETIQHEKYTADKFGGIAGELPLPADATLGAYQYIVRVGAKDGTHVGSGNFRVEEYKKPEFEVTVDAPSEPVMLGEKITATLNARYYFGSPVTEAKVKYKILRKSYTSTWFPIGRWDWLYGRGYWWFASNYTWYPGWSEWGCVAPSPWWWPMPMQQPELIAEREMEIGAEGKVEIEIDTAVAKEIHGNQDHEYTITAEVVDQSRRTIVGTGRVLVARKPFKVFSWVDRGHYRVGDTVTASFQAQTLDQEPVAGSGKLKLLSIRYDKNRQPVETVEREWDLDPDATGRATQQLKASRAGQYRLSYTVTDKAGHAIEGGYVFVVRGEGFDSSAFRFNHLELVPDKREYRPGETVNLLVNTDRTGGTVLLFPRAAGGAYLKPTVLRLSGKSVAEEIAVVQRDMPNFFIEALTIADGRLHTATREIVVPPEKRVFDVAIETSADEYKPGEKAKVKLKLTGPDGKPLADASTVLAVYDKALEYISGGSNVAEIKEFFWKFRRRHHAHSETNLGRLFANLVLKNKVAMQNLGVFGETVADEIATEGGERRDKAGFGGGGFGGGGFGGAALNGRAGRAMPMAAAAPASMDGATPRIIVQEEESPLDDSDRESETGTTVQLPQLGALVEPTVRTNFADTAYWAAALSTDENGIAEVEFDMPENLSAWKIKAWSMGHGTRVGSSEAEVVTRKNLILRLQAPRFFVDTDEVVLSANVHNYLDETKSVTVSLEVDENYLAPQSEATQQVEIGAGEEKRVDWRVRVSGEGEAFVRMKALTDEESDAMEMKFPVYIHGMLKMDSLAGALRPEEETAKFTVKIPEQRRPEQSRLEIRYSPTLAGAMVDALPYLVSYPYGCTEQTLNRFLPTVITQKILLDMNLDLAAIKDKRTNLNAQEIGDDRERARRWQRFEHNPVFDRDEVTRMVKDGLTRLTEMQLSDGGWGWFSGYGERSYPHTTAYVVHGLQIAQANDVAIVPGVLEQGVEWLKAYQVEQLVRLDNAKTETHPYKRHADNLDAFVYMVLADAGQKSEKMRDYLYRDRGKLAVYSLAMYGIALEKQQEAEKLTMVLRNISQFLVEDDENQTAWLNLPQDNYWWFWYGSEFEAQAYYLKLLSRTDPKGRVASRLAKYLINNRKHATYWNSTRDTAICIEALADFMRASGEDRPEMTVEVWVNGEHQQTVEITPHNLFTFDNKFVLTGDALESGPQAIELRKKGTGPLYYNAYTTNFTLEDFIEKAGLEIKVQRNYYKLRRVDKTIKAEGSRGQAVDQRVEKYEREAVSHRGTLKSGDLVEIELVIESKNDYEYLIFEDMKAAGFEPVEVRSGYGGNDMGAYMELRDNRVAFFVRRLARGKHSLAYRMRAEIPGKFSALPTRASAMYAPELKANSDEIKLTIE